ncbi:unnamed protein product [Aspergillus oryzae]|uniref:cAMP-dependent protein kinase n=1 Tax=Aspergillus oryzae TaxID=5062 RepID=A0AAN4Y8N7_ASPOZ|nr:unnamed protein product [Aspergillus oryzae]
MQSIFLLRSHKTKQHVRTKDRDLGVGTVDPSAPKDVQGTSAPAGDIDTGSGNLHEKEKQMVSAIRPPHQRHLSPFVITERPEEKQLGVSTRTLTVDDFALLKTLGTGKTHRSIWAEHGQWLTVRLLLTLGTFARLDYCPGGEIFSYLRRARRFNENTAKFYAAEITLTIEFLHDVEGIVYRDLKPENILLDAEGHIRLVDFGFAKKVDNRETYTLCGTPEYLAPEVIHNSGHGLAVDWWALGILIYEFLVGQPPFWDQNPMRIYEQIVEGRIRFPQNMSPAAQNIISLLCKTNPTERLGYISGGSARVKSHPFFEDIQWDDLFYRRIKGPIIPRVDHPADTGNFEEYPDPDVRSQNVYTDDLKKKYEALFSDF